MSEIDFTCKWQDDDLFGELRFNCPHCGVEHSETVHLEEEMMCAKCGAKFAVHQKQWIEEVEKK